ncbi:centrosome-associated zinc finger protein Cp190 isoform X1 [Euwallacea fornicatus]|uniref:centrosome-associated zinc finger protein Cp190 isoform X1 n=1 Tax=Euwallacea fornicatus TaxID=995702 RepID=UPI00338FF912
MVETSKQVRVDNWGIYFLQRLQLFFSKTDYCDLTLQFEGNVQLKVHRLVMNACTEYFAFLEQTCPALEENTIMMPSDLQADVIVPIVNFMYTGMLEFHPSIYDKLYRAAETMNIAVLSKLLEAQLAPMSKAAGSSRMKRDKDTISSWKDSAKRAPKTSPVAPAIPASNDLPSSFPGRRGAWRKKTSMPAAVQSHPASATFNTKWNSGPVERDPLSFPDNTPKPTRFEWPDEEVAPISMYPSFDDVSLTSKPLWTKEDDPKIAPSTVVENKTSASARHKSNSTSQEYEDDFAEKDQKGCVSQLPETASNDSTNKRKAENKLTTSPKRVKVMNQEEETVISITTSNPSEVDHTKIVSEVLKKYPELVKKKRNIKLKITQSKTEQPQIKIQTIKEKVLPKEPQPLPSSIETAPFPHVKEIKKDAVAIKETSVTKKESSYTKKKANNTNNVKCGAVSEDGPWICMECVGQDRESAEFVLYYLFRKHMTDQHQIAFDSSLCKYCGKRCGTDHLMIYHLYTKHGLKPPRNTAFPSCSKCPFIAPTTERLQEHVQTHGNQEVQCPNCYLGFFSKKDLQGHLQIAGHSSRKTSILDCAYCLKKLQNPVTLFTHVRSQHMKEARRDGVTSLDAVMDIQNEVPEEENLAEEEREEEVSQEIEQIAPDAVVNSKQQERVKKDRVKIISNVKVARTEENVSEENINANEGAQFQQEPEAVTTAATLSNIGGSIATNLGLVDIVVLDDNQQYILQQPQGQTGNAEFILPSELTGSEGKRILQAAAASGELNSTDELVMVLTDHDYPDEQNQGQSDNSNIVVLYSHPVEGQQGQFITSQGNLLVNSEGVLEIRNGAAITTTAGQLLVNPENTTTTQAIDSPVESIDLIRREIEGTEEPGTDTEGKELVRLETETTPITEETNIEEESGGAANNYDKNAANVNAAVDTTDSSLQEESMEVDDIEPSTGQDVEAEHEAIEKYSENVEEENASNQEAVAGQDVPPIVNVSPISQSPEQITQSEENLSEKYSTDDPPQQSPEPEPMEVDGSLNTSEGNGDEVDHDELQSESVRNDQEEPHSSAANRSSNTIDQEPNENVEGAQRIEDGNGEAGYEDFAAEESQDSSSAQEARKNFNKELLDDWEDTDSQQSHGQEQETQENEPGTATLKATENVNKLMDDWDDEEEDQSKE